MTSPYLEKLSSCFTYTRLSEAIPAKGEALLVIAPISHIKLVKLPDTELMRAERMTHEPSRERYLAGRHLVRGILAEWLQIPTHELCIGLMPSGKPFLTDAPSLHFSLSHTQQIVSVFFSRQQVGVDLEQERPLDTIALAQRFFSAEESDFLKHSSSSLDFFRFWCAREAAIKADGRGMGQLLNETKIIPAQTEFQDFLTVWIEGVPWTTSSWMLPGGIHGAVAFREPLDVIHWRDCGEAIV